MNTPPSPRRGRWQFGLAALLVTVFLASLVLAALRGVLQHRDRGSLSAFGSVALLVGLPLAVLVGFSLFDRLRDRWRGRRP